MRAQVQYNNNVFPPNRLPLRIFNKFKMYCELFPYVSNLFVLALERVSRHVRDSFDSLIVQHESELTSTRLAHMFIVIMSDSPI